MNFALGTERSTSEAIAREAGAILLRYNAGSSLGVTEKAARDVVTAADHAAEAHIVQRLVRAFPDDGIIGEEGARNQVAKQRIWYVDPLDGTFNFSRGIPFWCVSLGLTVNGQSQLGVVFDPLRDELFCAVRGQGALLNNSPICVNANDQIDDAVVQATVSFDRAVTELSLQDTLLLGRKVMRLRNLGALALELCYIACGRLDAVVQRGSHEWDYAAAWAILEEAGGFMTDLNGHPFRLESGDALASSHPNLHAELVAELSKHTRDVRSG